MIFLNMQNISLGIWLLLKRLCKEQQSTNTVSAQNRIAINVYTNMVLNI